MKAPRNAKPTQKWFGGTIVEKVPPDLICISLPGPCTHADIVRKIADRLKMQLDPLPEELSNYTCYSGFPPTGGQWWGSAEKLLTLIASKHGPIYWTVFDRNRLRFERRNGGKELSDFDELAGRLMYETQPQQNGQFSEEQYDSIAERLDREGFRPLKHLEKRAADKLRARNSKHLSFKGPLHTFKDALKSKEFCGAVKKRLSRAKANYQKSHLSRVFAPQPSRPAAP